MASRFPINPHSVCIDYYYSWPCGHEEDSENEGCMFKDDWDLKNHAHVRTNLGNPGYECPVCGKEPHQEPHYYPPIPENPLFTENDELQWQLDAYRKSSSFARFFSRWGSKGFPRYEYTRRLTMAELIVDLQYLSSVLRTLIDSRAERFEFRPSQMGCEAWLREWRAQHNAQAEISRAGTQVTTQAEPETETQEDTRPDIQAETKVERQADTSMETRRETQVGKQVKLQAPQPIRLSLNAYTAFRGEFIPGALTWSSNHRSRREAARARKEFYQQRRAVGNSANTAQQPRSIRRPHGFDLRSQASRRRRALNNRQPQPILPYRFLPGNAPDPTAPQYHFLQGNTSLPIQYHFIEGDVPVKFFPTPAEVPAQHQAYLQGEELARRLQEMSITKNQQGARPRI